MASPSRGPRREPAPTSPHIEVRLEDHPALREPGGHAEVRVPRALLDVVVQDGRVLNGPATRPLATFPAVRVGDSVFIHRPR
jgi:hypothetical protein